MWGPALRERSEGVRCTCLQAPQPHRPCKESQSSYVWNGRSVYNKQWWLPLAKMEQGEQDLSFQRWGRRRAERGSSPSKVVLEELTISRTPEPLEHLFLPAWRWGYEFRLNLSHPRYKLSTCPQRTLKVFHIWYLTERGVGKKRRFG